MRRFALITLCGVWFTATGWGFWKALEYQQRAGDVAAPLAQWPSHGAPQRDPSQSTLLVFVHPKCPCTRATLRELDRLLAHYSGQLTVYAVFLRPEQMPADWEKTDLWRYADAIPGVRPVADEGNAWRKMFHMSVSGECLLYAPDGRLLFHGGITAGRGHEGDSASQTLLAAALDHPSTGLQRTAVFGCALEQSDSQNEDIP